MSIYNKGNQRSRDGIGISLYPGGLEGKPYRGGCGSNRFNRSGYGQYNQTYLKKCHQSDDDDLFYENQNPTFESMHLENNWEENIDEFDTIGLNPNLAYTIPNHPTKIQSLCIKPIILNRNILVQSAPNSGKKTALCIGILHNINIEEKNTQALILVPNRLVASYIHNYLVNISNRMNGLQISIFINDNSIEKQREEANKLPHIVVATPGRAFDLIQGNSLNLSHLKMICFDEVDEFVSRGLVNKIRQLLTYIKPGIQVLVFSSIIPIPFYSLVEPLMTDPVKIKVEEDLPSINQFFVCCDRNKYKFPTIIDLYGQIFIQNSIIITNNIDDIHFLETSFRNDNFEIAKFHKGLGQKALEEEIKKFNHEQARILVSTDIPKCVSLRRPYLFINYDVPPTFDMFLERVKRFVSFGTKRIIYICNVEEIKRLFEYSRLIHLNLEEIPANIEEIFKTPSYF